MRNKNKKYTKQKKYIIFLLIIFEIGFKGKENIKGKNFEFFKKKYFI